MACGPLWPMTLAAVILGIASGTAGVFVGLIAARFPSPWADRRSRVYEGNLMPIRVERLRIGPYRLVRQLEVGPLAERWLAFNETDQTSHVAYRFRMGQDKAEQRRFLGAVEGLAPLSHPHLLPIEQFA